jgi:LysR family transcriptional regulator, regulator of abg operon
MTLQQLQDFLAIVRCGSVNAAARATKQTQPALSKSLSRLEATLGVHLLERTALGVRLTPYGEGFLGHARAMVAEAERSRALLSQMKGDAGGVVRYGMSPFASYLLAPAAIRDFKRKYPDVELHATSGMLPHFAPLLRERQLDFAVCWSSESDTQEFTSTRLIQCEFMLLARDGHPLLGARSLAELKDAHFVLAPFRSRSDAGVGALFEREGLPPPKAYVRTDSLIDILLFLPESDLVALVPVVVEGTPLVRNGLRRIRIKEDLGTYRVNMLLKRDALLTEQAAALVALVDRHASYLMHTR